jgi:hypothetical protein
MARTRGVLLDNTTGRVYANVATSIGTTSD